MQKKNLLLCVTGSIAAYKACDIVNGLKKDFNITVVMSESAKKIICEDTLKTLSENQVYSELFNEKTSDVDHIKLVKDADLILVAPISANTISKFAYGIADNLVSTLLVVGFDKPTIIAPAMNTKMYLNPKIQRNLKLLEADGVEIIEPRESLLACGDVGIGALAKVETIIEYVKKYS